MCVYLNLIPKSSILSNVEKIKTVLNHLDQRILLAAAFAFGCLALGYLVLRSHVILLTLKSMISDYLDSQKKQLFFSKTSNGKVNFHDLLKLNSSTILDRNITSLLSNSDNLSQLTDLDLRNNQLTNLPCEIGYLSQLNKLDLHDNYLTSLPSEIGNCSQLRDLYLSGNQLTSLPSEIGDCSQLRDLYLQNNQLRSLPSQLGLLVFLKRLDLRFNRNLKELPLSLGQCPELTDIEYEGTSIPESQVRAILGMSQALRNKQVSDLLPKRLAAWKVFSKDNFELGFIDKLSEQEKEAISEWLLRLER
ncbi:MAG: leucine-rich repeat domain-containing protein, partial [Parachlamydiaceae bacterium]